jgi:hypothetical protein
MPIVVELSTARLAHGSADSLIDTDTKGNACLIHIPDISTIYLTICLDPFQLSKPGLQYCRSGILKPLGINLYAYLSMNLSGCLCRNRETQLIPRVTGPPDILLTRTAISRICSWLGAYPLASESSIHCTISSPWF